MRKGFKLLSVLVGVALVIGLAMSPAVSMAAEEGPECLTIDTNGKKKKVPNFPHRLHQHKYVKDGCKHCHHKAKQDTPKQKDATGKACHTCHKGKKVNGEPKMSKVAHKVCKHCHKGKKATNPGSSAKGKKLDKCKTCHASKRDCMKP